MLATLVAKIAGSSHELLAFSHVFLEWGIVGVNLFANIFASLLHYAGSQKATSTPAFL